MNKYIAIGRLTADPELRQTQSGVATCRFTVAIDRKFADKNTGEKQADFVTCVAWRQTAEFVSKYFQKGSMIAIEGSLRNNNYQDKNHPDITHYTIEVMVDNVEFTGSKNKNSDNNTQEQPAQTAPAAEATGETKLSDFEEILGDGEVPF